MLKLLLAFDHEIPLGSISGTYEDAIFDPTDRIVESANRNGFRINLFTDILCAAAFRKHNLSGFYTRYTEQLHRALRYGHDVQLHIHPHWVDTEFVDETFAPSRSFLLADFADRPYPGNIEGIIEQATAELNEICRQAETGYTCHSYRAGGFCLSPATDRILTSLYNNGIRIDSSIVKGLYYKSELMEVNYRDFHDVGNWKIPLSGPLRAISEEGLFEVPIASMPAGIRMNLKHLYYKWKNRQHAYSSGKTIHTGKVNKINKLNFVFSARPLGFDIISLNHRELLNILEYYMNTQKFEGDMIISTISHPKNMGPYSIRLMEDFVRGVRDKYPDMEFSTYTDIFNQLSTENANPV